MALMLTFEEEKGEARSVTRQWRVLGTERLLLGWVAWHSPWRRYVFHPVADTLYDRLCLREIADFLEVQTIDQMQTWRRPPRRQ